MKLKEVTPRIRVGHAVERCNLAVYPLFAEDNIMPAEYVPVGAAIRAGTAKITEISEGGSVPTLALDNSGIIPILIIDGEELIGARQNRIANITILAPAKHTLPLPVSCVERGRWSYRSREFSESPDIMFSKARARKTRDVSRHLAMSGVSASDQGAVWNDISEMSAKLGYASPTDAMQDVYQTRRASVEEYVTGITVADGQIGAIFAINGVAAGLELFDSTETLRTYLPKILRSYSLDAIATRTVAPISPNDSEAGKLLSSIMDLDARSFPALGLGEDLRIESPDISGGALMHNGRVVHLAAFYTAPPKRPSQPDPDSDSTRPLVIRKGHILMRGGHGRVTLLDTGSPVSIGRGEEYRVAGHTWNPSTSMRSVLDAASDHIGRRVDWLFGHDFFAENRVVIDWPGRQAHILDRNLMVDPAGLAIPIELVMGVPVVTGRSANGPVRAVIDSGASLSYLPAAIVDGLVPVGKRKDFYPGFGEFETDVWRVSTEIGGRRLSITAGILPPMLQMMFGLVLGADDWIIGSDFFRNRVVTIDYLALRFYVS